MQMKVLNERDILSFSRFSQSISPLPPFPNLSATLEKALSILAKVTHKWGRGTSMPMGLRSPSG